MAMNGAMYFPSILHSVYLHSLQLCAHRANAFLYTLWLHFGQSIAGFEMDLVCIHSVAADGITRQFIQAG